MKGFKFPNGGITFKCIPREPKLHDQYSKGNFIGKIPLDMGGMAIPLGTHLKIGEDIVEIRFSKTAPTKDKDGNPKWTEHHADFKKGKYIVQNDKSEYWFFMNHGFNRDNKNSPFKTRQFYKEDAVAEAQEKRKLKQIATTANNLLWNVMSDSDALEMHIVLLKNEASSGEVARVALEKIATENPQKFIDTYNSDVKNVKRIILEAKSAGLIGYDEKGENKAWHWLKEGKRDGVITKIVRGRDAEGDLYEFLTTHGEGKAALELLHDALASASAIA